MKKYNEKEIAAYNAGRYDGSLEHEPETKRIVAENMAPKEVNNCLSRDVAMIRARLMGAVLTAKTVVDLLTAAGVEQWANSRR